MQLETLCLKVMEDSAEQPQLMRIAKLGPVIGLHPVAGVFRDDHDPPVLAGLDRAARPQADRRIQRLRAVVKEIERPDIEGPARQIDSRWSGSLNVHARSL